MERLRQTRQENSTVSTKIIWQKHCTISKNSDSQHQKFGLQAVNKTIILQAHIHLNVTDHCINWALQYNIICASDGSVVIQINSDVKVTL